MSITNTANIPISTAAEGISRISVRGYKSLNEECHIEIKPLTILAGANSSGKSSILQPLLLIKQTLEATYDPGALLINGPHVKFTLVAQLFSKILGTQDQDSWSVSLEINGQSDLTFVFKKNADKGLEIAEMIYRLYQANLINKIKLNMTNDEISQFLSQFGTHIQYHQNDNWMVKSQRCFLELASEPRGTINFSSHIHTYIRQIIHVPGLRGNPERTYKTTAITNEFIGTFENYVASIVNHWQKIKDQRLIKLGNILEALGLTWQVKVQKVDDTQVELQVGRLVHFEDAKTETTDLVNIADVGFGVSQILPVLVALLVAEPGQLVYLEQPEIHLHPRAQVALAEILAETAHRGVKVVVETHSELLITAVQSLVAEGKLLSEKAILHWFTRGKDGMTEITTAELDQAGAYGDWPEDFSQVSMSLNNRYLSAAEKHLWKD